MPIYRGMPKELYEKINKEGLKVHHSKDLSIKGCMYTEYKEYAIKHAHDDKTGEIGFIIKITNKETEEKILSRPKDWEFEIEYYYDILREYFEIEWITVEQREAALKYCEKYIKGA